jgi:hypothetical protein
MPVVHPLRTPPVAAGEVLPLHLDDPLPTEEEDDDDEEDYDDDGESLMMMMIMMTIKEVMMMIDVPSVERYATHIYIHKLRGPLLRWTMEIRNQ